MREPPGTRQGAEVVSEASAYEYLRLDGAPYDEPFRMQ